ncbi:hypothetical protein NDU88_005108 [Pleurodeles waltl]|uniref:Uncharacterized protein n=1 Tax=Pleurodeles waltl TaxID=8319 RepID=A0AAV7UH27_PLEWA|nr:hypothetical protein NDU88_005108 [Pleurodeles waltl]
MSVQRKHVIEAIHASYKEGHTDLLQPGALDQASVQRKQWPPQQAAQRMVATAMACSPPKEKVKKAAAMESQEWRDDAHKIVNDMDKEDVGMIPGTSGDRNGEMDESIGNALDYNEEEVEDGELCEAAHDEAA